MSDHPSRRARLSVFAVIVLAGFTLFGPADCGTEHLARIELCKRTLPAVAPPDVEVEVLHVGRGARPDSVRVDYRIAGVPELAAKARRVVCGFGARADLVSVTTEGGPLSGASVYLLKRYFLEVPDTEPPKGGR